MQQTKLESDGNALVVNGRLSIPRSELAVRASRSGGPGGQHVNTSSTRVEVRWNVRASAAVAALADEERATLLKALRARLSAAGELRVVASDTRSQFRNRALAEERLAGLVRQALVVRKPRKKTGPTRSAVQKRLARKHLHSKRKHERRPPTDE